MRWAIHTGMSDSRMASAATTLTIGSCRGRERLAKSQIGSVCCCPARPKRRNFAYRIGRCGHWEGVGSARTSAWMSTGFRLGWNRCDLAAVSQSRRAQLGSVAEPCRQFGAHPGAWFPPHGCDDDHVPHLASPPQRRGFQCNTCASARTSVRADASPRLAIRGCIYVAANVSFGCLPRRGHEARCRARTT
jgi:hypothetical protein